MTFSTTNIRVVVFSPEATTLEALGEDRHALFRAKFGCTLNVRGGGHTVEAVPIKCDADTLANLSEAKRSLQRALRPDWCADPPSVRVFVDWSAVRRSGTVDVDVRRLCAILCDGRPLASGKVYGPALPCYEEDWPAWRELGFKDEVVCRDDIKDQAEPVLEGLALDEGVGRDMRRAVAGDAVVVIVGGGPLMPRIAYWAGICGFQVEMWAWRNNMYVGGTYALDEIVGK